MKPLLCLLILTFSIPACHNGIPWPPSLAPLTTTSTIYTGTTTTTSTMTSQSTTTLTTSSTLTSSTSTVTTLTTLTTVTTQTSTTLTTITTTSSSTSSTSTSTTCPNPVNTIILSTAALDGEVDSSGLFPTTYVDIAIGDYNSNAGVRGFISFDLSTLPANFIVIDASFSINIYGLSGVPSSVSPTIFIDHLDYGPTLDAMDYNLAAIQTGFASFPSSIAFGIYSQNVTAQLSNDIANGRIRSQYRFRMPVQTNNNALFDYLLFYSREWGSTMPQLMIEGYYCP